MKNGQGGNMSKIFNTEADCKPELHYMVDISDRLRSIEEMIDQGKYFTINRGRQYGKTTTLRILANYLRDKYLIVSLDFQDMDSSDFSNVEYFAEAFADLFYSRVKRSDDLPQDLLTELKDFAGGQIPRANLRKLFSLLKNCCEKASRPIVLLIDEVDTASNNQVFLDFLAKLRAGYINRDAEATFQSVILAGVYDIKNLKRKFVNKEEHNAENSPWNISASFHEDMSFSPGQIAGMLREYETDHQTGMDEKYISELIYEYTSGYPVLVSGICKWIDEELIGTKEFPDAASAWTYEGVTESAGNLLKASSPLFESMIRQITQTPELGEMLKSILFEGESVSFNPDNAVLSLAAMFGYVKSENGQVKVSNRIFETRLYNYFLSLEETESAACKDARENINEFVKNGCLDMELLLRKFVKHFSSVYADNDQSFVEKYGRKIFLLYLKPVINGTGHYYIEAQTRDMKRTDIIVDYLGQISVIECKIWHGQKYNEDGEKQFLEYLDRYDLKKAIC